MANVIFKRGTKAQFNALESRSRNTLYWLEDVQEVWMGDTLFGVGREASTEMAGLLSAEDKAKLDALVAGTFDLIAADGSMSIEEIDGGKSIKLNISGLEGNAVRLESDGLFVPVQAVPVIPEYSIERQDTATEGYSASYRLKRTQGTEVSYVGDVINIPKDMVLKGGTFEVVAVAGVPYAGAEVGDPYIDLILSDANNTHIYIPLKGVVESYLPGQGIKIVDYKISIQIDPDNANGLILGDNGLGLGLATRNLAGAMSPVEKLALDSLPEVYVAKKFEITSKPIGTLVRYREDEIRVMCPADTEWIKQEVGPTGNSNMYYMAFKSYAPANAVSFKEGDRGVIIDEMFTFDSAFAGVDEYGRKYSICWLALASYDESSDTWTYFGKNSSAEKYIGWDYVVEWYDANGIVIESDQIRINLSNEDCHNSTVSVEMVALTAEVETIKETLTTLEQVATWGEM